MLLSLFKVNVKDTMLESAIQAHFISMVKKLDLGLAVKLDCSSRRGWPDVVFLDRRGETTYIEFKQERGRLSKHQIATHKELIELGADVIVISGMAECDAFILTLTL
jgi:hypothetical protein